MTEKAGVIYILTNPSFPDYVKIGYASDIEKRLSQLNHSECIPYAFRVYAIYETDAPLQDKKLHALIDTLNPELRSIEEFDGKTRTKEFYAMSAEDAYAILESIAEISNTKNRLKRMNPEGHEILDEQRAKEISVESTERKSPFSFTKAGIPFGSEIHFINNENITAKVIDDRRIEYQGEIGSLTYFAKILSGKTSGVAGPMFWMYNGRILPEIRKEREQNGLYK